MICWQGADLMIDGRGLVVPEYPDGNFVGPTLIHNMTTRHSYHAQK